MRTRLLLGALLVILAVGASTVAYAQKNVTIPQLQQVSVDSLLKLDTLQATAVGKTIDKSPNWKGADANADTVRVTGIVLVKARVLTYTLARYNIFIQDTTTGQLWGGLNVLTNDTSSSAQSTLITALDSGDVVTIVGRVTEFPTTNQNNSLTEMFAYSVGFFESPQVVQVGVSKPRPAPKEVTCDSFAVGTKPLPSRGEKYEGMYVVVRNVTVNSVDPASGRFTFVDTLGNQMRIYDGSGWYTVRGHRFSNSKYTAPPVGTKLSYVRGVVLPQALSGTAGEYTIMPLYPSSRELTGSTYVGDIGISKFAPQITSITRTPTPPKSADTVKITYKAVDLNAGGGIDSSFLNYKVGSFGTWQKKKVTLAGGDSLYRPFIPPSPNDSLVSYYVEAYSVGKIYGSQPDVTIPLFYRIRDAGLSIFDVQNTPYVNGNSGFVGDTVTVSGIVTADTSDYTELVSGRPVLFMAGKSGQWNGMAFRGNTAGVGCDTLKRGDSVQIRGAILETNGRTQMAATSMVFRQRGVTVPAATKMLISGSGSVSYQLSNPPVSGNLTFEQWEGVLVTIDTPKVVIRNADNLTGGSGSNFGEYLISSAIPAAGAQPFGLRVDDNGSHRYYADTSAAYTAKPSNAVLMPLNSKILTLTGILDYSFSFYKLEPRKDGDFGTITGVFQEAGVIPLKYELSQNYPNPFNPSTTIKYTIPVQAHVQLRIYNLLGQVVETLFDGELSAGSYTVQFNASRLATGVYFYQLQAGEYLNVKKMLLLK